MLIMATGGGKSLAFQLPPLILSRGALIISPTIAIMKEQVSIKSSELWTFLAAVATACLFWFRAHVCKHVPHFCADKHVHCDTERGTVFSQVPKVDHQAPKIHETCSDCCI